MSREIVPEVKEGIVAMAGHLTNYAQEYAAGTAAQPVRDVMKGIVMTLRNLAVTALMLGIAGTLTAIVPSQAATDAVAENMKSWDPDKDGTIDLAEANKAAGAKFDRLERDHDGTLNRKEMNSTRVDKKTFTKADPDKDGTLTKDEYLAIVALRFKAADPDNDGTVSVAELGTRAGLAPTRLLK
jgi:EF hand